MSTPKTLAKWFVLRALIEAWQQQDDRAPVVVRIRDKKQLLVLRNDVPPTREHCPTQRPCGHVRCFWHLWRVDGEDRAGNPKYVPGTTIRPAWLEIPTPPSCGLDHIVKGGLSSSQVAQAFGMHRANVWLIWQRPHVKEAFEKLRALLISDDES